MRHKISSKDFWYISIFFIGLSILSNNLINSVGLFLMAIISAVAFSQNKSKEIKRRERFKREYEEEEQEKSNKMLSQRITNSFAHIGSSEKNINKLKEQLDNLSVCVFELQKQIRKPVRGRTSSKRIKR